MTKRTEVMSHLGPQFQRHCMNAQSVRGVQRRLQAVRARLLVVAATGPMVRDL